MYDKTTKTVSKTEILSQNIDYSKEYKEYLEKEVNQNPNLVWENFLGLTPSKATVHQKALNTKYGSKSSKLGFFETNDGWLVQDFKNSETFNAYTFSKAFKNETRRYSNFISEVYNLKSYKEFIQDKKEQQNQEFYNSLLKEFNLPSINPYFSINNEEYKQGFKIAYTDLDKTPLTYGNNEIFDRIRLCFPYEKDGSVTKYLSKKGSGYFPYLTAIAHNKEVLGQDTLYGVEGEKKAIYGVKTLDLAIFGISGHPLGTITEKNPYTGKPIKVTAEFLPHTKSLIKDYGFKSYQFILDSDALSNEGKIKRALGFFSSAEKEFIAAQKVGITKFLVTIIHPKAKGKGLDDLGLHYEPSEIKAKLQDTSKHNDLFLHFEIDTTKNYKEALHELKGVFIRSVQFQNIKFDYELEIDRHIGDVLLEDKTTFNAITTKKTVLFQGDTGTGKSTAMRGIAKFFSDSIGAKFVSAAPRNVIASQQAAKKKDLLFVGADFEDNAKKLLEDVQKYDILYCNQDNMERLLQFLRSNGILAYAAIDELHLLPSDASFRKNIVRSMFRIIENNNTILLTATPKKVDFPTYNIKINSKNKKAYTTPYAYVGGGKKAIQKAIRIITNAIKNDSKVILLVNSIKTIRKIKHALEKYEIESYVFASKELTDKEQEEHDIFLSKDTFYWSKSDSKKVILCTSVLATGVNIESESNIEGIYFNKHTGFNNIEYQQFIARLRNYESINVINHIITKSYNFKDKIEDFDFDYWKRKAQKRCDLFNEEYKNDIKKNIESKLHLDCTSLCYFNKITQLFEIDISEIYALYERHLIENGSVIFENPIKTIFLKDEVDKETETSCKVIDEQQKEIENAIAELCINDFKTLCKAVHTKTKDSDYLQVKTFSEIKDEYIENEIVLDSIELSAAETLSKRYFSLIDIADREKVLDTIIQHNEKTGLLEFINTSTLYKKRTNIEIDYLLSLQEPNRLEKREKKLLDKRISDIEKHISNRITLKKLHEKVNEKVDDDLQVSIQYLSVLLDKFFKSESKRDKDRKTRLTITRKEIPSTCQK
ncbi:DEAD/DEAH box helicase (plasmid) [Bernardetia sp. OM2101]|uniref:DEAD/DEAH box helicase n=1 Tax=Bernardetia sp. OM2101 TaxID=3344876 RepID=UPI0035D0B04B